MLLLTIVTPLATHAQIGIEPFNFDRNATESTGWFVLRGEKGTSIEDFVVLKNLGNSDVVVDLQANDGLITKDGAFTIASNDVQDVEIGSWINLEKNDYIIPSDKGLKVPFSINIPGSIADGEYAGGLSIIEQTVDDNAPVAVKTRMGNRIYLTVGNDLSLSGEVKDLEILSPLSDDFANTVRVNKYIRPNNLTFSINNLNTGNVFARVKGSYTITNKDGEKTGTFNRDIAPREDALTQRIQTGVPYTTGVNTLKIDYDIVALNEDNTNATKGNTSGSLETSIDLSQENLDLFKEISENQTSQIAASRDLTAQNSSSSDFGVKQAETTAEESDNKDEDSKDSDTDRALIYAIIAMGSIITLAIIILIIVILLKKKKEDKDDEEIKKPNSTKPKKNTKKKGLK